MSIVLRNIRPALFYDLPGIVLKVETGNEVITAESITTNDLDEVAIVPPTKGSKITREDLTARIKKRAEEIANKKMKKGEIQINRAVE